PREWSAGPVRNGVPVPGRRTVDRGLARRVVARVGGAGAVAVRAEVEAGEEQRPALVDGRRIGLVAAVLLLHVLRVGPRHQIDAPHRVSLLSSRHARRYRVSPTARSDDRFSGPRAVCYTARMCVRGGGRGSGG